MREDVRARVDAIEEAYEYFLAYAAQGLSGDRAATSGGQLRELMGRMAGALDGLADAFRAVVVGEELEPVARWDELLEVVEADARAAHAAVRLVEARPSISSQLVDNLNANVHLRALLTDLFLVDDLLG